MTVKELANIIKKYREQQQQEYPETETLPLDEARARELLAKLRVSYNDAHNERKKNWFMKHPYKTIFEPNYEDELKNIKLDEWLWYLVSRISMTPHERYFETLAVGTSEEEAIAEKNKSTLDILYDYRSYQDFDMVQSIWIEQQ